MSALGIPEAVLERAQWIADDIGLRCLELGGRRVAVDAVEVLTGRAALLGFSPRGQISAGGATRLVAGADGWCALTLSRAEDIEVVPALLELTNVRGDPWPAIAAAAAERGAGELVARARLLGMPAAVLGEVIADAPEVLRHGGKAAMSITDVLVADLSSMWAGPLCGRLLAAAGATVVKVETPGRPDGTRRGHRGFFDWMNSGKLCYCVDFDSPELRDLLEAADMVIEGSRPAALTRRGLGAEQIPGRPGRIWLRITGYGSDFGDRVAFGDDAAVAGGLVGYLDDRPVFCGDAISDPLSGLEATMAVVNALAQGGGTIIDVSMAAVAATYALLPRYPSGDDAARMPTFPARPARELGADNAQVRRLIAAHRVAC
jgi:CoA-transferase family III